MRFGIVLIIIGLLALLNNVGYLTAETMQVVWPVTLVVVGAWMMLRRGCCWKRGFWGSQSCNCHDVCDHKKGVCKVEDR